MRRFAWQSRSAPQPLQEIGHLDGGNGGLRPLVPGFRAGPLDGLLDRVGRQHAEGHGNVVILGRMRNALGAFPGDVFEVRRRAPDDGTESDDGVVATTGGHAPYGLGHFPCARHPDQRDVAVPDTVADERVHRSLDQGLDDEFVESSGDDADPYEAGWLVIIKPDDWGSVVGSLVKGTDVTAPYEAKMDSEGFAGCE